MTTLERQNVRQHLLDAGFKKDYDTPDRPELYDRGLDGVYTEDWVHTTDRTRITLRWDVKTKDEPKVSRPEDKDIEALWYGGDQS